MAQVEAIDAFIELELRRGAYAGPWVAPRMWAVLDAVVEQQLVHARPTDLDALLAGRGRSGVFRRVGTLRSVEWLIQWRFVRRTADARGGGKDSTLLLPTIAGIAAARPFASLPGPARPPQELLRELCRGEAG